MEQVPGSGNIPGGSGSVPAQPPAAAPAPQPATPPEASPIAQDAKVEVKDGRVLVEGKKFVAESDLIAAKNSLEGKLTQQQTAHDAAIDAAKVEASTAQQTIAQLNAKIKENEEARATGAVTEQEAASVKQELETTKSSLEMLSTSSLAYRRELMVMKYGISADTIASKDSAALDSFEEAIKAVSAAKGGGVGPYAVGGGVGEAAPQTAIERATKLLASTPVRGVRNEPPQT